jgi:hypothetical protein
MKATVPTRKKIKLKWFKTKSQFNIERKIDIQYTEHSVSSNKLKWDAIIKYILIKEGENIDLPANSPMTLYKNNLPFLFLSTAQTVGNKIISEELIDDDIVVDDDIVQIEEGEPKISFEDALEPKQHIEVRTRYDKITRKINIENKLNNPIEVTLDFKQTKDVTYIKSEPEPSEIEEPNYKFTLSIPSEGNSKIVLELQAKITKRVTKTKPEFLKKIK